MNTQLQQSDPRLGLPVFPGRWPVVGHTLMLSRDLPGSMARIRENPKNMAWVDVGGGSWGLLWADVGAFDFLKNKVTSSEHMSEVGQAVVGESVVATDGAPHRRMRGAMNKAFTPTGLTASGVCRIINEVVETRVPDMLARPRLTMLDETQRLALDIIFRVMGVPDEELEGFRVNYNRLLMGAVGPNLDFPLSPRWWSRRARRWLDERFLALIAQARQDPDMPGLLAELTHGRDEAGEGQSDRELLDNIVILALAGHETTASIMAWMTAYVAEDPGLFAEIAREAEAGIPQGPKELANYPLTMGLFRECLRLHPPATVITRVVTGELVVEGVAIPEGTMLMVPLWYMGRDPELYPDPERFNPHRWADLGRQPTPLEKAGFGGGPHFCLGYHVAVMEGVSFMVGLMRAMQEGGKRLRFPGGLPRESYFPLLRPKKGDTRCEVVKA